MKYTKGFVGIGVITAVIVALVVGGGVVYYATKTKAPSTENIGANNYQPVEQNYTPPTNYNNNQQAQNPPQTTNQTQQTNQQQQNQQTAEITSFSVVGKNFVVKGKFLNKIEIWNIPSGTGIESSMYKKIAISTSYQETISSQTFTILIPCSESFGTNIFAKGYDQQGNALATTKYLPYNGVTEIYENVYKPACESTQAGTNSFFVVNADSGINVSNPTFVVNGNTYSSISTFLAYMNTLSSGLYNVNISAPGYQNMIGTRISVPGNLSAMVINLDPITHAHNCPHQPSNTSAFALCGYIADQNHNALAGVQVSSPTFGSISAVTASDGYYDTQFSPLQNYDCGNPVTFTYSKSGYKTLNYILNGPYIYMGGDMGTQLLMTHGSGTEQKTDKHGMCP